MHLNSSALVMASCCSDSFCHVLPLFFGFICEILRFLILYGPSVPSVHGLMIATARRTVRAVQVEVSAAVAMDPGRQEKVVFHMVYIRSYAYMNYELLWDMYICIYICYKYIYVCVCMCILWYMYRWRIERWYVCSVFVHRDVDVSGWTMLDLNNRGAALHLSDMICRWSKPGLINPKRLVNWGVPFKYWMKCGWNDYWRSTPLIVINQGLVSSGVDITWSPKTVPNHFP